MLGSFLTMTHAQARRIIQNIKLEGMFNSALKWSFLAIPHSFLPDDIMIQIWVNGRCWARNFVLKDKTPTQFAQELFEQCQHILTTELYANFILPTYSLDVGP